MAAVAAAGEGDWSFKDDAGDVHGFYDEATIRAWAVAGYLASDTEVQRRLDKEVWGSSASACSGAH